MAHVLCVYHSLTGTVAKLAREAVDGLQDDHSVRLRRVPELHGGPDVRRPGAEENDLRDREVPFVSGDDLLWAEVVLIGSPTRFGLPSAELLRWVDTSAPDSGAGRLEDKVVAAFTSACATNGGQVTTIQAILGAVAHWGALTVSTGSREPVLLEPENGNPYGVGNVSRNVPGYVPDNTLLAMRFLAQRAADIGDRLNKSLEGNLHA